MIKTLVPAKYEGQVVVALVAATTVNAGKLARAIGSAGLDLADLDTIRQVTGAGVGFGWSAGIPKEG